MKEYEIPDPETDPLAALVLSFKTHKNIHYDDRGWDRVNWARSSKSAKILLDICKGFTQAEKCLSSISKQMEEAHLAWTFETILKHAHDWIQKNGENNGTNARERLRRAIAEQRTKNKTAQVGELTSSGSILDSIRNLEILQHPEQDHNAGAGNGDVRMPRRMGEKPSE